MKITGKEYIQAIIAILKEMNRSCVSFDPKSFDSALTKNELPWCAMFDKIIDTISAPCLFPETPDDDEMVFLKAKNYPNCISICMEDDGFIFWEHFDGSENEDWDGLFFFVYDELRDGTEEEGDFWLNRFVTKLRREKTNKAVERAKDILIEHLKEMVLIHQPVLKKPVRIDKLNLDMDEYLPMVVQPIGISIEDEIPMFIYKYIDGEWEIVDSCFIRDMSLSDIQNIIYNIEDAINR